MGLFDRFKKNTDTGLEAPEMGALLTQLESSDARARVAACRELAKLGPRAHKAAAKLHELTCDDDGDVCNAAAAALSDIERDRG